MRKICPVLLLLFCALGISAQTIRLRPAGLGKVSLMRGRSRSIINLSREVAGCPYTAGATKRSRDKEGCAAPPATFKMVDSRTKNNQTYLVIQSEAMGNCNVCGQCGASEAYALIWLKLDSRLKVLDKRSVPVDHCLEHITGLNVEPHENDNLSDLKLSFKNDILIVEYEKTLFNDNSDISGYEFSHLEYNRKTPEKSFIIKTEKRDKSSNN